MPETVGGQMPLTTLSQVLASDYKGPQARFSQAHAIRAIVMIGENSRVGRTRLSALLDLGQGEIRTLIKRLKDSHLISVNTKGCELTEPGRKDFVLITKIVPWRSSVDGALLGIGRFCWAFVIRGRRGNIRMGIEQRDAAIKAGASGVLTVIYSGGRFLIPIEGTDCESSKPSEPWETVRRSNLHDGDVVIVSGGEDSQSAENGGWTAALTLI